LCLLNKSSDDDRPTLNQILTSGTETKREVWLLRTWFGIASVN